MMVAAIRRAMVLGPGAVDHLVAVCEEMGAAMLSSF